MNETLSVARMRMFKSKIHRATVTEANVDYEGSVSIDSHLMQAAGILPFEEIHIWNVTRGTRLVTYVLEGPAGSGVICINGAAAHLHQVGDLIILATFFDLPYEVAKRYQPTVVLVGANNQIIQENYKEEVFRVAPQS